MALAGALALGCAAGRSVRQRAWARSWGAIGSCISSRAAPSTLLEKKLRLPAQNCPSLQVMRCSDQPFPGSL